MAMYIFNEEVDSEKNCIMHKLIKVKYISN